MKPEEIDKLFKDRLGNSSPTPSADLWSRLQERMEQENVSRQPIMLVPEAEQKDGKRRFMWVYSSVAATLSLLLAAGVIFYNIRTGTPEVNQALTKHDNVLKEEVRQGPSEVPAAEAASPGILAQQDDKTESTSPEEKNITPQATAEQNAASTITKQPAKQQVYASATPKAKVKESTVTKAVDQKAKADVQTAIAANSTPEKPAVEAQPVKAPITQPAASANLNAEPVEIIIKRAVATQAAAADEELGEPTQGSKRKALAKSIFKQVRNLASGEGVELSELGIRADRVALETQIG
ncbi:MAG: hypothetical protein LPK03_06495, partial [Pontibacter sp.]|nr:hypothetical protein [Pontibacter sp.]